MTEKHNKPDKFRYKKEVKEEERLAKKYHLDYDKMNRLRSQHIGAYYKGLVAKFSDKEMDNAMKLMFCLGESKAIKPEKGLTYNEAALFVYGDYDEKKRAFKSHDLPDDFEQKIDRLLYIGRCLSNEFFFGTTIEKSEQKHRVIGMFPMVKEVTNHPDFEKGEKVPMIFNGARREYMAEYMDSEIGKKEIGEFQQWAKEHPEPKLQSALSSVAHLFTEGRNEGQQQDPNSVNRQKKINLLMENIKGDIDNPEYIQQVYEVASAIMEEMKRAGSTGVLEPDLMHNAIPGSIDKTGEELKYYQTLFEDALYSIYTIQESKGGSRRIKKINDSWKLDHGYLEGR